MDEEYFSFVEHLDASNADLEVRRVAHVIRVNLQRIADAPSAGGRRSHNVAAFLRGGLNRVEELPQLGARAEQDVLTWSDLKALKIGPFRGFRREEIFDLSKRVTLFYGPNGSGKTSLCEAIEYALTGDVEEASLKRAGALGSYFTNIHEGRYLAPVLFSQGDDEGVPVAPVPGLLRFAIIEKNRIESFARIAARTPAQAGELIASLFGLEEFSDFVKQFPAEIDIGLLLETPKKLLLEGKASALAAAQARLRDADVTSKAFVDELSALAAELECNIDHVRELIDPDDRQSRLQGLITAADEIIPAQSGLKASGVRPSFLALRRSQRQLHNVRRQLADLAGQVSFKKLFQSIQELRAEAGEACPACLTPLAHAVANPFERADHELRNLQELAVLEDQASTFTEGCNELLRQIRAYLAPIKEQAGYEALANNAVVRWAVSGQGADWNIDGLRAHHVRDVSKALAALEAGDLELSTRAESRQQVISERDKLRDIAQRRVLPRNHGRL
ncbi:AAA family ATPase [Stenotrophomonas maltophilia]